MKRFALILTALCLGPGLSGCCCCGSYSDYGSYNGSLPYDQSYSSNPGGCCQNDEFSLPPEGTSYPMTPGANAGAWSQGGTWSNGTWYGPETMGPEIVGPGYVPNGTEWQGAAPPVPGSNSPVTPANPGSTPDPSSLSAPSPIPAINSSSVVVPPPAPPYSPASQSNDTSGPMMPPVPPPPPEPISQMRFRQYR